MTYTSIAPTQAAELTSHNPFLQELIHQFRAQDTYGTYRNWTDQRLLNPYILSKAKKREISVEGEVEPLTQSRILAFYRAIAGCIEKETGLLCQVVIDLSQEGFGWALVFSGRLLLVSQTLRDAHRFGFDSFDKLAHQGQRQVDKAIDLAQRYPEVGRL